MLHEIIYKDHDRRHQATMKGCFGCLYVGAQIIMQALVMRPTLDTQ